MRLIKYILVFSVPVMVLGYSFIFSRGFSQTAFPVVESDIVAQNTNSIETADVPLHQADLSPARSLDVEASLYKSQFADGDNDPALQVNADSVKLLYHNLTSSSSSPPADESAKESPVSTVYVHSQPSASGSGSSDSGSSASGGGSSPSGSGSSGSGGGGGSSSSGSDSSGSSSSGQGGSSSPSSSSSSSLSNTDAIGGTSNTNDFSQLPDFGDLPDTNVAGDSSDNTNDFSQLPDFGDDPVIPDDGDTPDDGNDPVLPDDGDTPDISYNTVDTNQISQFGITWKFDKAYPTGQFANGDYWVVGPVTIINIDPLSTDIAGRVMNGSMINPSPSLGAVQGYDSAMYGNYGPKFNTSLNASRPNGMDIGVTNPLVLHWGSSLVSAISNPVPSVCPQLKTVAILTVLAKPAPQGSFRPAYCGTDKSIKFNKSQLDYSKLKSLLPVPTVPALYIVERYFERPWIDHVPNWMGRYCHPSENMPDYGREISANVGTGALVLNLDLTNQQKEKLLCSYVQLGIDLYSVIKDGGHKNWLCSGGHASGRKFPILFAGVMLDDADMKAIGNKSGDYLYSGSYDSGNIPPDYIHFGEDDQTFYVSDNDIYELPYEEHNYKGFIYYGHGCASKNLDYIEYTEEHRGLPEWGIYHTDDRNQDGLDWDADYRRCCTANSWAGFVLAAHIMGIQALWNHDALFDYQDRYMQMEADLGTRGTWMRQQSIFTEDMWDYYRSQYGPVWSEPAAE